jgi:hypothetical protein
MFSGRILHVSESSASADEGDLAEAGIVHRIKAPHGPPVKVVVLSVDCHVRQRMRDTRTHANAHTGQADANAQVEA